MHIENQTTFTVKQKTTILIALEGRIQKCLDELKKDESSDYWTNTLNDCNEVYMMIMGCEHDKVERFKQNLRVYKVVTGGL